MNQKLLILTNSGDETANYLVSRLKEHQSDYVRIDTDHFAKDWGISYLDGIPLLEYQSKKLHYSDVKNLWFRRPKEVSVRSLTNEESPKTKHIAGEWGEALENFLAFIPHSRWLNHPTSNYKASQKAFQESVARQIGLNTPQTLITTYENEFLEFYHKHSGEIITKPLKSGFIEYEDGKNGVIYTNEVLECHLDKAYLLKGCPGFFQQKIKKKRDIRVTVIDDKLTAVSLVNPQDVHIDIRRKNMIGVKYEHINLDAEIIKKIHSLMKFYNLRFGALDFVESLNGDLYFLEINPNGQWAWLDITSGSKIYEDFLQLC